MPTARPIPTRSQRIGRSARLCATDLPRAGISGIEIERQPNQVHLIIDTARPGVIIGRKGVSVNALRTKLQDMTGKKVKIDVREIARPELDARSGGGERGRATWSDASAGNAPCASPCRRRCAPAPRAS